MSGVCYPVLYQVNTRILVNELSASLGRTATLDDLPGAWLDRVAGLGFDWIWLLGVWSTGEAGRVISGTSPAFTEGFGADLPDWTEADVCGSPFALRDYSLNPDFGGPETLARLRERLRRRGVRLMLDFVANHTALDHPWVATNPEYYVKGTEDDLLRTPGNYGLIETDGGPRILAHGRDPYFPGWIDTWQLNYRHRGLREAMVEILGGVAGLCDGVRCDMAMLLLPEIFLRTWGDGSRPADGSDPADESFWAEAIGRVKGRFPEFTFLAEAYWDLEWALQQQGFDFCYDKRLYDRLRESGPGDVRNHLRAGLDYQSRLCRFLENHDERRAAAVFPPDKHRAAAVAAFFAPGMRFLHEGQLEGRKHRASIHLGRRVEEPVDAEIAAFYDGLLAALRHPAPREGDWRLLEVRPVSDGDPAWGQLIAYLWEWSPEASDRPRRWLVVVNYGPSQARGFVEIPLSDRPGATIALHDLLGPTTHETDAGDLATRGFSLDLPGWGHHVFEVVESSDDARWEA